MSVKAFALPQIKAIPLIAEAANTNRTIIPDNLADGEWPNLVLHRQIVRCLQEGEIIGGPVTNEHGHFEYRMRRISAGQEVYLTAVLFKDNGVWMVAVTEARTHEY